MRGGERERADHDAVREGSRERAHRNAEPRAVPAAQLPEWLRPLASAAREVSADELSSFLPPSSGGRRSAVLILVGEDECGPTVLLTERAHDMRSHPGQPSFPGGRLERTDRGPIDAALREAAEETGVDPAGVDVVAVLPDLFLPVGSSVVTPVIGWWRAPSPVRVMDAAEVASVHVVALADLVEPANRLCTRHPSGYVGPAFTVDGLLVWGFTAGLLDRLLRLGGFERPWDTSRVEPLPDDVVALALRGRGAEAVPVRRDQRP